MRQLLNILFLLCVVLTSCTTTPQKIDDIKSEYATIDDSIRIHYKTWSNRSYKTGMKTVCFVHGFGCDLNTWEKQFEGLRDEENLRMIFIDLPGYGQSSKPHVDYTLDFFARAINTVLEKNRVDTVILVGHSLGTPVCRHILLTSHRPGFLVDIDGVYCFYDGTETPEYVNAVQQFGHSFDNADCQQVIAGFVTSLAGPKTPKGITEYAMNVMPQTPQYVASSTMQNLVDRRWWPQRTIKAKTMVLCTKNSGIDPDNKEKMKRLFPDLDYTELNTCGHFIHMEEPEMVNSKLKKFIFKQ